VRLANTERRLFHIAVWLRGKFIPASILGSRILFNFEGYVTHLGVASPVLFGFGSLILYLDLFRDLSSLGRLPGIGDQDGLCPDHHRLIKFCDRLLTPPRFVVTSALYAPVEAAPTDSLKRG